MSAQRVDDSRPDKTIDARWKQPTRVGKESKMTAWTELTLEYTSALCRIPLATLQATSARCLKHTRDTNPYDGPWGIIRFTREPSTPELLMFAIMTLDGELLDLPDYEPFSTIGGTLVL